MGPANDRSTASTADGTVTLDDVRRQAGDRYGGTPGQLLESIRTVEGRLKKPLNVPALIFR